MKAKGTFFLPLVLFLSLSLLSPGALGTHRSSPENGVTPLITSNPGIGNLAFVGFGTFPFVSGEVKETTKTYKGFLFVKAQRMCTRSEGPDYYLQPYGDEKKEIRVLKHGSNAPFAYDLTLNRYLLTKVVIEGTENPEGIVYSNIKEFTCFKEPGDGKEKEFHGYLFAKLDAIGMRSEGPSYYLQQWDYTEIHIRKDCKPWENDPRLHPLLNTKVTITGTVENGELTCTGIKPFQE